MTSDILESETAATILDQGTRVATRNLATSSGESRSQLYRRLRSEGAWDVAEEFKEIERARCRSVGMTKAQAGAQAWDSIAVAFPPPDTATWNAFTSRALRPPLISQGVDLTDEIATLAAVWCVTMKLSGSLATRCPEVAAHSSSLLQAVDVRQSMESASGPIINEEAILKLINFMISDPTKFVRKAKELFARYEPAPTPYGTSVSDELNELIELMELLPALVEKHWDRITPWLFGPRRTEAERFLARACENQAELSSRIA
jgi:hypothetical protein